MADLYIRIDDRLIHGQTIVAWCPTLRIKEIVAVDEASAKEPALRTIMAMGVPSAYKTHIVTAKEAKEVLKTREIGNRLVIVRQPKDLVELGDDIRGAKAIILGNLAKKEDSKYKLDGATGIFYLSDQDVKILDGLAADGLDVFFHQLPTSARTTWSAFKKTI